jgi:hypothetical protein
MAKPVYATLDVPPATDFNSWLVNVNYATKSATESVPSSTTLQDDNDLTVPVEANAIYTVHAMILYGGPTAADLKLLFRTPTSGSFTGMATGLVVAAATAADNGNIPMTGNSSEVFGCLGAGTQIMTVLGKLVTAGTAGNFKVEWAQNTSNVTPTQVFGNSFLDLRRVS